MKEAEDMVNHDLRN